MGGSGSCSATPVSVKCTFYDHITFPENWEPILAYIRPSKSAILEWVANGHQRCIFFFYSFAQLLKYKARWLEWHSRPFTVHRQLEQLRCGWKSSPSASGYVLKCSQTTPIADTGFLREGVSRGRPQGSTYLLKGLPDDVQGRVESCFANNSSV